MCVFVPLACSPRAKTQRVCAEPSQVAHHPRRGVRPADLPVRLLRIREHPGPAVSASLCQITSGENPTGQMLIWEHYDFGFHFKNVQFSAVNAFECY